MNSDLNSYVGKTVFSPLTNDIFGHMSKFKYLTVTKVDCENETVQGYYSVDGKEMYGTMSFQAFRDSLTSRDEKKAKKFPWWFGTN